MTQPRPPVSRQFERIKAAVLVVGAPNPDTPPDSSGVCLDFADEFLRYFGTSLKVSAQHQVVIKHVRIQSVHSGLLSGQLSVTGIREEQTWNCNIGQITQRKDANLQLTNYQYSDPLRRTTRIDFPDQGYEIYTYNDSTRNVTARKNIPAFTSFGIRDGLDFDQLGRASHRRLTSAPEGRLQPTRLYDNLGRIATASNPYVDDFGYDLRYNHESVRRPRSHYESHPAGRHFDREQCEHGHFGNCATVTDQAGKKFAKVPRSARR